MPKSSTSWFSLSGLAQLFKKAAPIVADIFPLGSNIYALATRRTLDFLSDEIVEHLKAERKTRWH